MFGRNRYFSRRQHNTQEHGQSLIEYAFILAIVAIAVMVVVGFVGLAAQRQYGIAAASIGTKHNDENHNGERIVILQAACYVVPAHDPASPNAAAYPAFPNGVTALFVTGETNVALDQLTASTERGFAGNISLNPSSSAPGTFAYNPQVLFTGPNAAACPRSVTVQSRRATIAISPIQIVYDTN